ncbi:fimbrial protein, partial [Serratia marcescens]|nr:type 1 fimbrial protein [Serratia marcescens]
MRATETNRRRSALLGAGMVMVAGMMAQPADAAENMRFHGTLVAEPCVIQPGDEDIQLDFGTIVDKYLYLNTRTHSQTFALHLTECDLSLGNTVAITFTGTENAKLPGLLALDAGSMASGIGIGLEDSSGKALPLNRASDKFRLNAGNTT